MKYLLSIFVSIFIFSACGGGDSTTLPPPPPPESNEPLSISAAISGPHSRQDIQSKINSISDAFFRETDPEGSHYMIQVYNHEDKPIYINTLMDTSMFTPLSVELVTTMVDGTRPTSYKEKYPVSEETLMYELEPGTSKTFAFAWYSNSNFFSPDTTVLDSARFTFTFKTKPDSRKKEYLSTTYATKKGVLIPRPDDKK